MRLRVDEFLRVRRCFAYITVILAISVVPSALAQRFALPAGQDEVVGAVISVAASHDETLLDIARRFDVGQDEILMANPTVDRWLPADGAEVTLPTAYILPRAERRDPRRVPPGSADHAR
jgi:L,D-transpeptidase ErfK/SrfK